MSIKKLDDALDTMHWALCEYCEDHARDGKAVEKAWLLLLKETEATIARLIHPMADDKDVEDAKKFLEVLRK